MRRIWIVPMLVAALGCRVGPHVGSFEPAHTGAGITVVVETAAGRGPEVELLALGDTAFLILAAGRVTSVPYAAVRRVRVHQRSELDFGPVGPTGGQRNRLRILSRYPQGVSPELLERLLAAYRQPDLVVIDR